MEDNVSTAAVMRQQQVGGGTLCELQDGCSLYKSAVCTYKTCRSGLAQHHQPAEAHGSGRSGGRIAAAAAAIAVGAAERATMTAYEAATAASAPEDGFPGACCVGG